MDLIENKHLDENELKDNDSDNSNDDSDDDDDDNPEHICSSMISDSFYIFKQNLERNISTQNLKIIKGGINNINSILNENLKTVMKFYCNLILFSSF